MNKELVKELHKKADKPRPRPLMGPFYDHKTGLKYYVRKHDLSYFELRKKFPPKPLELTRCRHILQRTHILSRNPKYEHIYGYIIAGSIIAFATFIVITYLHFLLSTPL